MKLRIFSDLHLEFQPFTPPHREADAIVLAGDTAEKLAGLDRAREQFPTERILFVAGNHEFYGMRLPDALTALRARADELGIDFLENRAVEISGVRFLGTSLWTDYAIEARNEEEASRAMAVAKRSMNDYRHIRFGRPRRKGRDRMLPGHVLAMHRESRAWLASQLIQPFEGRTVVITHHGPHRSSVPARAAGDPLTPCYASHPAGARALTGGSLDPWAHS
ncbi:metallophosphoesterase family protein [Steroidobacter flavus]|uniref:Metallophosphoesterase family protein n=1 Tax=Steroidobacter flavus TaxID=1842136 RepID=A0ABV8SZ93_9GAMM